MTLDVGRARTATGFHDIGVERALHQEVDGLPVRTGVGNDLRGCILEYSNELAADDLALGLGVTDAGECGEEALLRINDDELHTSGRNEVTFDLLSLALAQ